MYNLEDYFRSQQVSLQWSPIMRSMAAELSAQLGAQTLHPLFVKIGQRFAKDMELQFQGVETLPQLSDALNDFWSRTNWGWVELKEGKDCIEIEHRYAPLAEAFGSEMLAWSVGVLEGFYQTVFKCLGASDKLAARLINQQDEGLYLHLRLAL